jgi:hypothetical protein
MTGRTSAGSPGLRGIVVLGMDPDGPRVGKLFVLPVTGQAEVVVVIGFDQLGSAGPSMGIMAIEAEDPCIEMTALLKVEPLLVMGFGMGLRISPDSRFKLVVVGQGISYFIRLIAFVIPRIFKRPIRNADSSRMALAANLQASFVL